MTSRTCVMASCPRTPRLTRRSVYDSFRAGDRPETCAFQATKCLRTFCWWAITLCLWSGSAGSAWKHASSTVSHIHPRLSGTIWWESSGIVAKQKENQINLMTDKEFIVLRNLLDSLYCRLHAQDIGCIAKPTEALTQEDEGKLWDSGVLNQNA